MVANTAADMSLDIKTSSRNKQGSVMLKTQMVSGYFSRIKVQQSIFYNIDAFNFEKFLVRPPEKQFSWTDGATVPK